MSGFLPRYILLALLMLPALATSASAALPWTEQAEGPGVGPCSAAVYNGAIYFYGGRSGNVFRSEDGESWFKLNSSPGYGDSTYQLQVFDGALWAFSNDYIYSTSNGSNWSYRAYADWNSAHYFRVEELGGKLWIYTQDGGIWSSTDAVNHNESTTKAPWGGRTDYDLVKFNNAIYLIGGKKLNSTQRFNDVWSTTNGTNWTLVCANASWSPRGKLAAAVYKGRLWVLGGETADGVDSSEVWSSATGAIWTIDSNRLPWQPRHGHAAIAKVTAARGEVLYLFGGDTWQRSSSSGAGSTEAASTQLVFASYASGHDAVIGSARVVNVERLANASVALTVKNIGTSTWTAGYGLKALYDDPDNLCSAPGVAAPVPTGVTVRPGQSYTFTVPVNTLGLWDAGYLTLQMYSPTVYYFGDRFELTLNPAPTQEITWRQISPVTGFDANRTSQVLVFNGKLWADNQYTTDGAHWIRATSYYKDPWKGRQRPVLAVYRDRLWLLGGRDATDTNHMKDAWSTEDGIHWRLETSTAPWPTSRPERAMEWQGKLLALGQLYKYYTSEDGKTWQTLTSTFNFNQSPVVSFENKLWNVGKGDNASYPSSSIYTLSPATYRYASSLPFYRRNHATLAFRDRLWVIGGQDYGNDYLNMVLSSPDGGNWTPATPLPFAKGDYKAIKAVAYKDKIWLFVWRGGTVQIWTGTPAERMTLSTRMLDLGPKDIQSGLSAPRSMTLYNRTGSPMRVNSVSLLGSERHLYRVTGIVPGQIIPATGSITIQAAFDPARLGPTSATLRIGYTGYYNPTQDVSLIGDGTLVAHDGRYYDILCYLMGLTKNATGLDMNGDGKVTIADLLRQKSVALRVTSPAAGTAWKMYSDQTIRWSPGSAGPAVNLALRRNHVFYQKIADNVPNTGSYAWKVPYGVIPDGQYSVAISSPSKPEAYGESAPFFSIIPFSASVDVQTPDGGEQWTIGSTQEIRWIGPAGATRVRISLYKGGNFLSTLAGDTANDGSFTWVVPASLAPGNDYHIAVAKGGDNTIRDTSANSFTVVAP